MKLRNKRTGEIAELSNEEFDAYKVFAKLLGSADWVEYKPAEPLIKDEKIRNLVREWIKLWEIEDRWHVRDNNSGEISIAQGDIELILPLSYGIEDGHYTLAELCGEEE